MYLLRIDETISRVSKKKLDEALAEAEKEFKSTQEEISSLAILKNLILKDE
jgi:multidrug resistance efflux pump